MKKNLITEIERNKELMGFKLLTESFDYKDISSLSKLKTKPLENDKYFVIHHTGGRGSAEGVVNVLNNRKDDFGNKMVLGIQWVIDRNGNIFMTLPRGAKGKHIKNANMPDAPKDLTNATAQGVEIVGSHDGDILPIQCLSCLKLIKSLGYSPSQIYGHGEVNRHKARNEGSTCKNFVLKHWSDDIGKMEIETPKFDKKSEVKKQPKDEKPSFKDTAKEKIDSIEVPPPGLESKLPNKNDTKFTPAQILQKFKELGKTPDDPYKDLKSMMSKL